MAKTLIEMAAEIVTAQVSNNQMTSDEISDALKKLYETLKDIKNEEALILNGYESEKVDKTVIDPKTSIQRNKIICIECGKAFKQISKFHLQSHGLTPKDYKKKYSIPSKQALTAKSLTAKRRKFAKENRLGSKLAEYRMKKTIEKKAKASI